MMTRLVLVLGFILSLSTSVELLADEVDDQLKAIAAVGPGGSGSKAARIASKHLGKQGPEILTRLLEAMDTDNIVAANWYRTVYEQIVVRELAKDKPNLPYSFMKKYVTNPRRQGRTRRLLVDFLEQHEPGYRNALLPTLLDDPEFRSEAIARILTEGDKAKKKGETELAKRQFRTAFQHAIDSSQISQSAQRLKSLGEEVSIIKHMGFVTDWYVLGPFDAPGKSGFEASFPPETSVDLQATYKGKQKTQIRWERRHTDHQLGQINLIQAIAPVKEAVGYAYTELVLSKEVDCQIRCGADDNCTVWLNGKKVFSRLQWLNGTRLDRFSAPTRLKKGKNLLLVKICQGPQHKNPAVPNNWSLQIRFCDKQGKGIEFDLALPAIETADAKTK